MALNTNPFVEGIDPTSTFGGYASVLLQLIRQAIPSSTYGMVLFDTTAPDVTGSNAWRKTCIWLNLTNPNTPTVNVYKEGTSPGWINTNVIIADNSISTSMIKDYNPATPNTGVTLPKLATIGGTALQLIRVNATATAFEFVSLASLVTVGSILPSAISGIAVAPGTFRVLANLNGGTTTWYHPDQVVQGVSNAVIDIDQIAPSPVTSARSRFITTRTADATATWRYFDPNVDILAAAMNGNRLTDFTVSVSKISPGAAVEGSLLSIVGGVPDWAPAPIANYVDKYESTATALPTFGNAITPLTHGLGGQPINVYGVLVCVTPQHGYILNDEIQLNQVYNVSGSNEKPTFYFHATATQIHCVRTNVNANLITANANTGAAVTLTDANWNIKFYAIK
jgi:hypothetical protein